MKPWKAIYGGIVAGLGALLVAVQTEDGEAVKITLEEGLNVFIITLTTFGGVYFVNNKWGEDGNP